MSILDLTLFSSLVGAATTFFLGALVFFHSRAGATNKIFIFHALVGTVWSVVTYMSLITTAETALVWIRLVIFFAVLHVLLFFLFVENFPSEKISIPKIVLIISSLIGILLVVLALSPYAFKDVRLVDNVVVPEPGNLMPLFGSVLVVSALLTLALVIRKYFVADRIMKHQWAVIGTGFFVSYTLLIFFVFVRVAVHQDTSYVLYSPLFILPIFGGAAYAIFRYHSFNVKLIATEIFTFFLLAASFAEILIAQSLLARLVSVLIIIFLAIFGGLLIRSVLREVEQREQLEELSLELKNVNNKLRELSNFKMQLLSLASHQIKAPLAVIKGFADILLEGLYGPMGEKVKETVLKIRHSADDLITLINTLLDLRRVDEGRMEFQFARVNLLMMAGEVAEQLKPAAAAKAVTITLAGDECMVRADEQRLRQVIQNLIDNAVKYTPGGFVRVTVTDKNSSAELMVEDSGLGMPAALLAHLFEEFVRDERVKKQIRGTGLGLYIAKKIVEGHGGRIWAESKGEGKGSTFHVELKKETSGIRPTSATSMLQTASIPKPPLESFSRAPKPPSVSSGMNALPSSSRL